MSDALVALKAKLERFREDDAAPSERGRRMPDVTPGTGESFGVLVRAIASRRVLEVGSSHGYGKDDFVAVKRSA